MIVNPPQFIHTLTVSGNLISNGDFEYKGNFAPHHPPWNWSYGTPDVDTTSYTTHSGTFKCQFEDTTAGSINQLIPQTRVNVITAFTLWYQTFAGSHITVTITYTDSTTDNSGALNDDGSYAQLNVLVLLNAAKTVAKITITKSEAQATKYAYVDDIVMLAPIPRATTLLTYPPQS